MSINIFEESLLTFAQAARILPKTDRGTRVHISSIWRWARAGLKGTSGMVVRLETVKVGGRRCTSKEALQRFLDRLQDQLPEISPPYPTSRARKARERQIEREWRMMGGEGDARIFETSTVSKERLCDLHEYIELKMPRADFEFSKAYLAVRSGIFRRAVDILEGKAGPHRGMEAAKQWVDSLDLLTMDVCQLYGVGPLYESEWALLLQDPEKRALISRGMTR
jgi:hypothetical protein